MKGESKVWKKGRMESILEVAHEVRRSGKREMAEPRSGAGESDVSRGTLCC
jgi:hypothetical protein